MLSVPSLSPRVAPSMSSMASLEMDSGAGALSSSERRRILCNRGRTRALSFALAAVFGIRPKRIEVATTTLAKCGARTHIVHYLYAEDLKSSEAEKPIFVAQRMYAEAADEAAKAVREHFGVDDSFEVIFDGGEAARGGQNREAQLERAISNYLAAGEEENADDIRERVMS